MGRKKIFIIIFLIMMMCKNVGALKVLVLYVYIDYIGKFIAFNG